MKPGRFGQERPRVIFIGLCLLLGSVSLTSTGCSVYMAAHQPVKKDLAVLKEGTPRSSVLTELGQPVWSGEKDGSKVDVFAFKQGYSTGAKAARSLFHGVADVFTLGLWEVLGTPIEMVASGTDTKVEVTYDGEDRVKLTKVTEGKEEKPAVVEDPGRPVPTQR